MDVREGGKQNTACAVEETLSKLKAITHMRTRTSTQDPLVSSSSAKGTKNNSNFKKLKSDFFLGNCPVAERWYGTAVSFLFPRGIFYEETKKHMKIK